ncbi:hypothetical protein X739_09020 [Mesorhizobium sp. LNHC220B00]|nr:hypothetical protein X739_09020 [Mesorhizobium sp. LNHC220B00]
MPAAWLSWNFYLRLAASAYSEALADMFRAYPETLGHQA